ncbi:dsDNA nuclease domain-containing protein [Myxococcus faecalis]|uniref:dsDNA nuclease domain-containing protein n=1 Tax=Myxococcus faecalis TaxID=3115646 RepID=UPI003CF8726E
MPPAPKPPSIHDLEPLESGGTTARVGFAYQDHIAADFCVEMMLTHGTLTAVWCEVLDDITLVWTEAGGEHIEFVQVKSDQGETLWTVPQLCEREKNAVGASILEKSLKHARCHEPCRFRLVTTDRTKKELHPLTLPREAPDRQPGQTAMDELGAAIIARLPEVDSDGPRGIRFWLRSVFWDVRGTQQDVQNATTRRLGQYLYEVFTVSAPDHIDAIYDLVLHTVWKAANERVPKPFTEKKVLFSQLLSEVQSKVNDLLRPHAAAGGPPLRQALSRIGLPDMDIQNIMFRQRAFRTEHRRSAYLALKDQERIAKAVEDTLHDLRLQYAAGVFQDTPLQFHQRCRKELEALHAAMAPEARPPLEHLMCAMYELVSRKVHSFQRDGS